MSICIARSRGKSNARRLAHLQHRELLPTAIQAGCLKVHRIFSGAFAAEFDVGNVNYLFDGESCG